MEDVKTKKIIVEEKAGAGENAIYAKHTVYLDEKGLPVRTDIEVVSPTGSATSTTIFAGKTVTLWVTTNNETKMYTMTAAEEIYEGGVFHMSLRYLPIEVGYSKTMSDFSSFFGRMYDVELNVSGKEDIQIGNKIVECFVVEIKISKVEQPMMIYLRTSDLLLVKQIEGVLETRIKPEQL